jgi:hypothetical protein
MEKRPEDRFQSASELLKAIDDASKAKRSGKKSVSVETRNNGTIIWAGSIAIATIALLTLATVAYLYWPDAQDTNEIVNAQHPDQLQRHAVNENENGDEEDDDQDESDELQIIIAETSDQLSEALAGDGNLLIKLTAGETYTLDRSFHIEHRVIEIESDPDDHAVIETKVFREDPSIMIEHGDLLFRSVDIRNHSEAETDEPFLQCSSGELNFEDVFMICDRGGTAVELSESELTIVNSVLAAEETLFVVYPMQRQEITISDAILISRSSFEVIGSCELNFVANESKFLAHHAFMLTEDEESDEFLMKLTANDCLFACGEFFWRFDSASTSAKDFWVNRFRKRFEWASDHCTVPLKFLYADGDEVDESSLTWQEAGIEMDSDSQAVETDETWVDALIERIFESQFETVAQVKESMIKQ